MKFVDLQSEYLFYKKEIDDAIQRVIFSGRFLLGNELESLEAEFSSLIGVKDSVGVKNCTDAINILIRNIWKPGMPIIVPNFGAYPTAIACKNVTDEIYYVDVDDTMTINPKKLPDIKNGIIIPVHLFGNNCDMDAICDYASQNNHIVIEDCAQSTGSGSGTRGDFSVYSFYPTKPLSSMGDGGMICTDNVDFAKEMRKYRFYGQHNGKVEFVGINSRFDEIQSAIIRCKMSTFQDLNDIRIKNANRFKKIVNGYRTRGRCVFHLFTIRVENRDKVSKILAKRNIPTMIHYPHHVTDFKIMKGKNNSCNFRISDSIISIPCHPFLKEDELQMIEEGLYEIRKFEIS